MKKDSKNTTNESFKGGGEMGDLVNAMDWSKTPLGPIESWPPNLWASVSLCLTSNFPMNIIWGPDHIQIYNDSYKVLCGALHPAVLGQNFKECWISAWSAIGEPFELALAGKASFLENQRMFLERNGYPEETCFTYSLSPIRDSSGEVVGIFLPVIETTPAMLSRRRTRVLRDIADIEDKAKTLEDTCKLTIEVLSKYAFDLPMVLLYLLDKDGQYVRLMGATGLEKGSKASPKTLDLSALTKTDWPLDRAIRSEKTEQVDDFEARFGRISCGPYPEAIQNSLILPIRGPRLEKPIGFLIVGKSTRLVHDEAYST
ncbi:MAG: hypothetical protein ABIQ95_13540, partial [Bdellovibrionia bacterium]